MRCYPVLVIFCFGCHVPVRGSLFVGGLGKTLGASERDDRRSKQIDHGPPTQPDATPVPATENSDTAAIKLGVRGVNGPNPSRSSAVCHELRHLCGQI